MIRLITKLTHAALIAKNALIITAKTITNAGDTFNYTATATTITLLFGSSSSLTVDYVISGNTLTVTYTDDADQGGCRHTEIYTRG